MLLTARLLDALWAAPPNAVSRQLGGNRLPLLGAARQKCLRLQHTYYRPVR